MEAEIGPEGPLIFTETVGLSVHPFWSLTVTVYSLAGTVNKWNCSRSGVSDTEITVSNSGGYASPRSQLLYISTSAAFVAATGYGHFVASAEL